MFVKEIILREKFYNKIFQHFAYFKHIHEMPSNRLLSGFKSKKMHVNIPMTIVVLL
jgi:hypothetical protein